MSGLKHCCKCSFYILTVNSACHAASLGFPLSGGMRWSCVLVDVFPPPNRVVQDVYPCVLVDVLPLPNRDVEEDVYPCVLVDILPPS